MASRSAFTRVATIDERDVLEDERFRDALRLLADSEGRDWDDVQKYAHECLSELAVRPADRYLDWIAALARFMYTRSFEPEFDVNSEALEELKSLSRTHPMVFLWSHKSHLDGFVFVRTLYDAGFRPQPLVFAGINMNFAGFGPLARHSGAIFLRRSLGTTRSTSSFSSTSSTISRSGAFRCHGPSRARGPAPANCCCRNSG